MFGIDMETDIGSYTPYYEGVKNGTPLLLEALQHYDIYSTFYFSGICAKKNADIARMVVDAKHEVGCHSLYHETVGDELFPLSGVTPLLPNEVAPRLQLATEWIQRACGVHPTSFRAPRLWGSTAVVNALESLHYTSDCSYPMYYHRNRLFPYHPSRTDWTQIGNSPIIEIPVFADMTMESADPQFGRDRDQWPLFRTMGAAYLLERVDHFIAMCVKMDIPCVLSFYMHPWEFWPMKESYMVGSAKIVPQQFLIQNCGKTALHQLTLLIEGLLKRNAKFVTAQDLAGLFQ
jgi:hypothetical protein